MMISSSGNNSHGFTLLELLITMLIMTLALLALSVLKNSALTSTVSSQQVTEATACAEKLMEELMAQGYGSISGGTASGTCPYNQFDWKITVSDAESGLHLKKIIVEVKWFKGSVSLKTLLSDL